MPNAKLELVTLLALLGVFFGIVIYQSSSIILLRGFHVLLDLPM